MDRGDNQRRIWYPLAVGTFAAGAIAFGVGMTIAGGYDPVTFSWIILSTCLILFLGMPLLFRLNPITRITQSIPLAIRKICVCIALLAFALLLGMGLGSSLSQTNQSFSVWLWVGIITGGLASLALVAFLIRTRWKEGSLKLWPWQAGLGIANLAGLLIAVAWSNWNGLPAPDELLVAIMLSMAVVALLGVVRLADDSSEKDVIPDAAGVLFGTLGLLLVGVML